jgi:hypothetical protein
MTPDGHSDSRPHSHDHADSLDEALLTDRAARRALVVSLCGLLATGAIQAVIVAGRHPGGRGPRRTAHHVTAPAAHPRR